MMPSFTKPNSVLARLSLITAVILSIYVYYLIMQSPAHLLHQYLYIGDLIVIGAIIIMALIPWYGIKHKGHGIEIHLERVMLDRKSVV